LSSEVRRKSPEGEVARRVMLEEDSKGMAMGGGGSEDSTAKTKSRKDGVAAEIWFHGDLADGRR
jgi:hypothetical protein